MKKKDHNQVLQTKGLLLLAAGVLILLLVYNLGFRGIRSLRRSSQYEMLHGKGKVLRRELATAYFGRAMTAATSAAESPIVRDFVLEKGDKRIVDGVLDVLRDSLGAEIIYVMNRTGLTVASTSYVNRAGKNTSLLGKNYEFRPYFRKAMEGELVIYPALGVTTDKRGIYCSAPISHPNGSETLGCVVIKMGLDKVDQALRRVDVDAVLFTASGVVFAGNRDDWMYRCHPNLGDGEINLLIGSRQFADRQIRPLAFDPSITDGVCDGIPSLFSYHNLRMFNDRPGFDDWHLALRAPIDPAFPLNPQQRQFVAVTTIVGFLSLVTIFFLLWVSRQRSLMLLQIAESEEKYRSLSHNLPVGVYRNTPGDNGHIVEANPAMAGMFRVDERDQLFGVNILQLCRDGETQDELSRKMNEEGSLHRQEVNFQRNDGTDFYGAITAEAVKDQEGVILHYDGIIEDITERRKVELALVQSEQRFREIFNATDEGIFVLDMEKATIFDVNDAVLSMYGFSREALVTMTFSTLSSNVAPYDHRNLLNRLARIVTEGPQLFEWRAKQKDGDLFWVEVALRKSSIMGAEKALAVVRDISKRKDAEAALREKQERLTQVEKMESIGHLAGGIAHDFNNMLAGISGAAEVLAARLGQDERMKPLTNIIIETSRRASELTQKLLAFSSRHSVPTGPIELNSVAEEALVLLERSIDKQIVVEKHLQAEQSVIQGDRAALQNAILNLGINSRDSISENGRITISTENLILDNVDCDASPFDITPGSYIKLTVQDDGVGIAPELQHQIFEPFFTTKDVGKGTGLGLAAVYSTTVEHQGAIELESELGGGAAFNLFFPVKDGQKAFKEPTVEAVFGVGRVLLVDDEEIIRTMGSAMLEDLGYSVQVAADGDLALKLFREHKDEIDVVLLDLVMPNMGGREAFEEMKNISPDVKVIICSGYSMGQSVEELMSMGAVEFLQKPYRRATISRAIMDVLGK